MRRLLFYWAPAIGWAAVILIASGDAFAAANSSSWLGRLLGGNLAPETLALLNLLLRKLTHVAAYAILGALAFRAVRGEERGWRGRWAGLAIGVAALVALVDEGRQLFVHSRAGSLADVAMDCAGAALAAAALKSRSR